MSKFEPNALIKECIEKGDLKGLRGALTTIIYRDRNFSTDDFDNSVDYVLKECGIKELYEPLDKNQPLFVDSIKNRVFTEENFGDAIYELKVNFCKERIEDVKAISREMYPVIEKRAATTNHTPMVGSNTEKKQSSHHSKESSIKKNSIDSMTIVKSIAVVAAVAVVIAIIAKSLK